MLGGILFSFLFNEELSSALYHVEINLWLSLFFYHILSLPFLIIYIFLPLAVFICSFFFFIHDFTYCPFICVSSVFQSLLCDIFPQSLFLALLVNCLYSNNISVSPVDSHRPRHVWRLPVQSGEQARNTGTSHHFREGGQACCAYCHGNGK